MSPCLSRVLQECRYALGPTVVEPSSNDLLPFFPLITTQTLTHISPRLTKPNALSPANSVRRSPLPDNPGIDPGHVCDRAGPLLTTFLPLTASLCCEPGPDKRERAKHFIPAINLLAPVICWALVCGGGPSLAHVRLYTAAHSRTQTHTHRVAFFQGQDG